MKKTLFLTLLALSTLATRLTAQESTQRAQNVYVEFGGQGILFSANYDTRFGNRRDGLGGRAGIGYVAVDGTSVTTVPISLNYLLGKGKNFFEIGLGTTFASAKLGDDFLSDGDKGDTGSAFVGTMSFMYRLQPVDSGFSLRAGFTPVFNSNYFIPYFFGVSLGYTF